MAKSKANRRERTKRLLLGRERQVGDAYRATDFGSAAHKAAVLKYERALKGFQRTLPKGLRPKGVKPNPAPSPAKRSAKFHRIRKGFVAKLKAAVRRGDLDEQAKWGRKLLKLDRMFYAPRNVKRRARPNPSQSKTKYYIVCINYPVGSAYAQITSDTHGDERFSFRITGDKDKATFTQSLSAAKRWAKGIANTARFPTTVETAFQ